MTLDTIDVGGFEAAAWRRRVWLTLYNAQRYLNLVNPVDDSVMDGAIEGQRAAGRVGESLALGRHPDPDERERFFLNWWTTLPVDVMRVKARRTKKQ